jgi:hypothetical protein
VVFALVCERKMVAKYSLSKGEKRIEADYVYISRSDTSPLPKAGFVTIVLRYVRWAYYSANPSFAVPEGRRMAWPPLFLAVATTME